MPKPWFFGISFSATVGSFTRWRILRATKSLIGGVGLAVGQHVAEVALPDAEAALGVELLEERLALLRRHLEGAARVGRVQEAGEGLLAALEHLGVAGLDLAPVVARRSGRCAAARTSWACAGTR